jgi:uncharacterized membrane protein YciS (DUF1049 family)
LTVLRRILFVLLLVIFVSFAAIFASTNPEQIAVDVGFMRFESVPMAGAFAAAFGLGWLFGVVTAGAAMLRLANDRRRLRRNLKTAESELSGLRSLPLNDTD